MESSDQIFQVFQSFGEQLPTFLALVAGLIFAITRWKQYPKVAMIVAIALGFLFIHQVVFTLVYNFVPRWFISSAGSYEDVRNVVDRVYLVLGLISNGSAAIGFGVLLAAIFMRRTAAPVTEN